MTNEDRRRRTCETHVHCDVCRTDERQRRAIGMPDECPYGIDEDDLPTPIVASEPAILTERRAICTPCELRSKCRLWKQKDCLVRKLLVRPLLSCPADPPRWLPVAG